MRRWFQIFEIKFEIHQLFVVIFFINHLVMRFLMLLKRPDKNDLLVVSSHDFIKYSVRFLAESL